MHPAAISGIWSSPNSLKVRSRMSFQPREGIWPGRSALRPRPGWSASTRLTGEVLPSPTPSTARCPDRGRPRRGTRVADHLGGRKARVKAHRGVAWPVARRLWDRSGVSRCMPLIKLEISSPDLAIGAAAIRNALCGPRSAARRRPTDRGGLGEDAASPGSFGRSCSREHPDVRRSLSARRRRECLPRPA